MARGRMLSKSLSTSVKRGRLPAVLGPLAEFAQALYPLLVAHADDFGREIGDPFTVKSTVDPSSRRSILEFADALIGLKTVGLIRLYAVPESDRIVLEIVDFDAHQTGLHKRTQSRYPDPPSPEPPGISGIVRSRARAELELNLREPNLRKVRADAPTFKARPVEKPKIPTLAAMVRADLLPLGITDPGDLIEAAKRRAAQLKLKYTSSAIRRAIASASGQLRKRARV